MHCMKISEVSKLENAGSSHLTGRKHDSKVYEQNINIYLPWNLQLLMAYHNWICRKIYLHQLNNKVAKLDYVLLLSHFT